MRRFCSIQQVKKMSKYSELEAILFVVGDEGMDLKIELLSQKQYCQCLSAFAGTKSAI